MRLISTASTIIALRPVYVTMPHLWQLYGGFLNQFRSKFRELYVEYATYISNRPGVNSQGTYFLLSFHTFNSWIIIRYYTACNMSVLAVRAYRLQLRLSWKNFLDCGNTFLSFGSWHLFTSSLFFTLSSRIVLSLKANLRWIIAAEEQ